MTPRKPPRRPPGLDNLLNYVASHIPPCCPSGDDDPDPAAHDPSCWFPELIEQEERRDAQRTREGKSVETRRTSPVTPVQERALWLLYRRGTVDTFTPPPDDGGKRLGWPVIHNLTLKGLVESKRFDDWVVRGDHEYESGTQEYRSPAMWEARLTRAGQEWIGDRLSCRV